MTMTASLFWCVGHGVCIKVRQTGRQVNRFLDNGQYISVSYQVRALARLERVIICSMGSVMTLTHDGLPSWLAA